MDEEVTMKVSEIIALIGGVAAPLAFVIGLLWRRGEAKSTTIVSLTRSFIETQKDTNRLVENNTRAMEDNTKVMEKLPEQFVLLMKANGK